MLEIDARLAPGTQAPEVPDRVESLCAAQGLIMATRGTLATYPGCVHWHFKRPGEKGTLEITWWAKTARLWFKVADGREGPWIRAAIERVKKELEA